jgi:hypothetical protein
MAGPGQQGSAELIRKETAAAESARALADAIVKAPAKVNMQTKFSSARRLFEAAAESYIVAGRWRDAAKGYAECAKAEQSLGKELVAATYYVDAGDCAERVDHGLAVHYYVNAVAGYVTQGRFPAAAAMQRRIAVMHSEDGATLEAAKAWTYAGELFLGADDHAQGVLHFYEAAKAFVYARRFKEASKAFDRAAAVAEDCNMLRARRPQLLMESVAALLATGEVSLAEELMLKHAAADHGFRLGREFRFLRDVVAATKVLDVHGFMDRLWNFDYVHELLPHQLK